VYEVCRVLELNPRSVMSDFQRVLLVGIVRLCNDFSQ